MGIGETKIKVKNDFMLVLILMILVITIGLVYFKTKYKSEMNNKDTLLKITRVFVFFFFLSLNFFYLKFYLFGSLHLHQYIESLSSFNGMIATIYFFFGYVSYGSVDKLKENVNRKILFFFKTDKL